MKKILVVAVAALKRLGVHRSINVLEGMAQVWLAQRLQLDLWLAAQPFRCSEDFGDYLNYYQGAFFGLGAGLSLSQLHHSDCDFPEEFLPTAASLF